MLNYLPRLKKTLSLLLLLLGVHLLLKPESDAAQVIVQTTTTEESQQTSRHFCPADLKQAIEAIITRSEFQRSRWGILVQTQKGDRTLYAHDAKHYFIPASNVKLLTTAAALLQLGSQLKIRTSVYGIGTPPNLTTLRVVGRGDPSLMSSQLKDLAQQLKRQGVRQVQQLIVEDGYFQKAGIEPTWEWEDINFSYGVAVNSLILNENAVTLTLLPQQPGQPLRVQWDDAIAAKQWQLDNQAITAAAGTPYRVEVSGIFGQPVLQIQGQLAADAEPDPWELAIVDPARYFLETFRNTLATEGIRVTQASVTTNPEIPSSATELAAVESPLLAALLIEANRQSNNLYAEALLHTLAQENSSSDGLEVVKQTLTELGVDPSSYQLVDGSGLSRHNLLSPEAVVQTLQLMAQTPEARIFRTSLSVAGANGTLRRRFQNTPVEGNLQAKTGTMSGISTLSGYLNLPSYQPLVFSIMINQSDQSVATTREAIDEIVLLLMNLSACH